MNLKCTKCDATLNDPTDCTWLMLIVSCETCGEPHLLAKDEHGRPVHDDPRDYLERSRR